MNADELREHFDHSGRSNAACHIDRQTFTGVLIDHRQTLQLLPVGTGVKHEVVRPDPVLGRGRYRPRPRTGETAARSLLRHLKPCRRPYPVGAVGAHRQTTPLQENLNPSVPEAGKLSRELLHGGSDGFVLRRHPRAVAERRARYRQQRTGSPCRNPAVARVAHLLLCRLLNAATELNELGNDVIARMRMTLANSKYNQLNAVQNLIKTHIDTSAYAARLLEIAMHSLMQAKEELGLLIERSLVPISQMRSANKKHGNIGDIELSDGANIVEAWDAKYGKTYLRDELEELIDKLDTQSALELAGFVSNDEPVRMGELKRRIDEIDDLLGVRIEAITFDNWVRLQVARASQVDNVKALQLPERWLIAYVESIAQKRRKIAPIDEPCVDWLRSLKALLEAQRP